MCMFPTLSRPFPFLLRVAFSLHPPCDDHLVPLLGCISVLSVLKMQTLLLPPPLHPHEGFVVGDETTALHIQKPKAG